LRSGTRAQAAAAVLFSARKSKQSSVFVAFFHDMACILFFLFNKGGGERTKDICVFSESSNPFLLSKSTNYYFT